MKQKIEDSQNITVQKLLEVLTRNTKKSDRENAQIEVWCGEQEYEIKSIGGFCLSPNIVFQIKPITSPILRPMIFKKEHKKMVDKKVKEIKTKCKH